MQSLNAKPFKNSQIHEEIGRKSCKTDKYQQIGQSLGAPTFVEAVQAMTPEMRQRKVVLGPIFARAARQRHSLQQHLCRARSNPLRPNQKQKQSMSTTLALTGSPMPKQHTEAVVLPRATSAFDQGSSSRPTTMRPHSRMKKPDPHSTHSAMAYTHTQSVCLAT
jgi:hypothetical protein